MTVQTLVSRTVLAAGLLVTPLGPTAAVVHAEPGAEQEVRAPSAAEPTVAELLERIEALETALEEVRRENCRPKDPVVDASGEVDEPSRDATATAPAAEVAGSSGDPGLQGPTASEQGRPEPLPMPLAPSTIGPPSKRTVGYNEDGFFIKSADGQYKLKLDGYLQADSRFFADSGTSDNTDEFVVRRARLDLRAKYANRYGLRMNVDFSGGSPEIKDGYVRIKFAPWLVLKAGQIKTPFGIERQQSTIEMPFLERSLTNNLLPDRDIGLQLRGKVFDGRLDYALAVVNGVPDGDDETRDINDSVDVAARVFTTPFSANVDSFLRGLGFGVATTYGKDQGSNSDERLPAHKTAARTTFFEYEESGDDAVADGGHIRVSPQATWFEGAFGLMTEYVWSSQQIAREDQRGWIDNQAWQVRTEYVLTGEHASMDGVQPHAPFHFGSGNWGAWGVALRWSSLDVDGKAFRKGFADPEEAARHADALGAAISWYLNDHVLLRLHYERTMFGGGAEDGRDRDDEDAILTRMQFRF